MITKLAREELTRISYRLLAEAESQARDGKPRLLEHLMGWLKENQPERIELVLPAQKPRTITSDPQTWPHTPNLKKQ